MDNKEFKEINCREKRYQWVINVLLILVGFFAGIFFEAERLKTQVVTNTVEIRILKDSLSDIQDKLSMLIDERRSNN